MSILEWIVLAVCFVILLACLYLLLRYVSAGMTPERQRQFQEQQEKKRRRQQWERSHQRELENELEALYKYLPAQYQVDWYRFVEPPPQRIIDQARYVRSLVEQQSPE